MANETLSAITGGKLCVYVCMIVCLNVCVCIRIGGEVRRRGLILDTVGLYGINVQLINTDHPNSHKNTALI